MDLESPERQSGINRVVNATLQQEAEVLKHFRELFERNDTGYYEREKNEAEDEIIRDVLARLPDFIREFGGMPIANLGSEHIHIVDESKLSEEHQKLIQHERGWYLATYQAAFVVPDASRLRTAEAIVHELMHFSSFTSLSLVGGELPEGAPPPIRAGDKALLVRRIGLNIFNEANTRRFLRDFDEAVIEELTKRFDARHFDQMVSLSEEYSERKKIRSGVNNPEEIAAVLTRQLETGAWQTEIFRYAYPKQRERLNALMRDIYQFNPGRFRSTEEVFKVFAEAILSGRLLKVADLIEETFGKGAFRELALDTVRTG
jgi:hypothetical protein